ncbi:MAG: NAD-dependent epimerase/dehydratase family protein [Myxococcales bacterium]
MTHKRTPRQPKHVLITGGAGFVGTNLADRLLREGTPVLVLDNLSRPGVERNLRWLKARHEDLVQVEVADIRDRDAVRASVDNASAVFHFAAQVAVTTSLVNPTQDFLINGLGTLNVLEAVRAQREPPPVVFTSTNKVYGALEDVSMRERPTRYEPGELQIRLNGISEQRPLAFHSPYGCSKGAADQYILDYSHTFSIPTTVFRMSCIYGPHQFGTEDQGWVAHFLIQALEGRGITLYGDGKQVRDILFVEDLVEAFLAALSRNSRVAGQAFNIGGGPANTTSLLELIELIGELHGTRPQVGFDAWRPADQRYYVSDFRKFTDATGWMPTVSVREGVQRLYEWLLATRTGAPAATPPRLIAGEATL